MASSRHNSATTSTTCRESAFGSRAGTMIDPAVRCYRRLASQPSCQHAVTPALPWQLASFYFAPHSVSAPIVRKLLACSADESGRAGNAASTLLSRHPTSLHRSQRSDHSHIREGQNLTTDESSAAVAGATRATTRSLLASFLRILPRVAAVKFFRPKPVRHLEKQPLHVRFLSFTANAVSGVILFGAYGIALHEPWIWENVPGADTFHCRVFTAGILGGAAHAVVGNPLHTLLCTPYLPAQVALRGPKAVLRPSFHLALFQGFPLTLLRDSVGCAVFFSLYEGIQRLYDADHDAVTFRPMTVEHAVVTAVAGASAGLAYELWAYPFEKAKYVSTNRINSRVLNAISVRICPVRPGNDWASSINAKEQRLSMKMPSTRQMLTAAQDLGMRRLYSGFWSTARRTMPVSAITFFAYEMSLQLFESTVLDWFEDDDS